MDLKIESEMTVQELLNQCPQLSTVLIRRSMACVGCDGDKFHTITEIAKIYNIDLNELLDDFHKEAVNCKS